MNKGVVGIVAFELLSWWAGLARIRGAGSWSYPGDYLEHGPVGWTIMLVPIAGFFSPLLAAFLLRRAASPSGAAR